MRTDTIIKQMDKTTLMELAKDLVDELVNRDCNGCWSYRVTNPNGNVCELTSGNGIPTNTIKRKVK